jgi:hypothetical protein
MNTMQADQLKRPDTSTYGDQYNICFVYYLYMNGYPWNTRQDE